MTLQAKLAGQASDGESRSPSPSPVGLKNSVPSFDPPGVIAARDNPANLFLSMTFYRYVSPMYRGAAALKRRAEGSRMGKRKISFRHR